MMRDERGRGELVRCGGVTGDLIGGVAGGVIDQARMAPGLRFERPEAVVLDMDGTLLDTEGAYRAAFVAAMRGFGAEVPEDFYAGLVGISSRERAPLVHARFGADFPWQDCLRDYRARKARLLDRPLPPKPGVAELLAELSAQGRFWAVATSAGRRTAMAALGGAGLLGGIAALVTRDEVEAGKPDPALFLRAAAALGTPPSTCLAVEDSPPGVAAARAAGMRVVMVPDALPPEPESGRGPGDPGLVVMADLLEVRALLRRLRNGEGGTA
jgi:HAD superfamily hydrolase (TIGR01509 family)